MVSLPVLEDPSGDAAAMRGGDARVRVRTVIALPANPHYRSRVRGSSASRVVVRRQSPGRPS